MTKKSQLPVAKKIPHEIQQHGHTRIDNYHWLRDKNWQRLCQGDLTFDNPEIFEYLKTEQQYADTAMEDTQPLQDQLYKEILSKVKEDDERPPMKWGDYYYYSRTEKGKDYVIRCRKKGGLGALEEIYFDENIEAKGYNFYRVGAFLRTPDSRHIAYTVNTTGSMDYTLKVRDLQSGKDLDWEISGINGSVAWALDYKHLFYIQRDPKSGRGHKLFKVSLEAPASPELLLQKPPELEDHFMFLSATSDRRYVKIDFGTTDSNQLYFLDAKEEKPQVELFWKLAQKVRVDFEHHKGKFYIKTNEKEQLNNKVMVCSSATFGRDSWEEYIPERENLFLEGFDLKNNYLIQMVNDNEYALGKLLVRNLINNEEYEVKMKDEVYDISYLGELEFDTDTVQLEYESPIRPAEVLKLNLKSGKLEKLKAGDIPGLNPDDYEVKREFAPSHDGKKIPLTLAYKKGTKKDGAAPGFVYGYGSYGLAMPPYFSAARFPLFDRGFVYAIAHIRGGSDKGYGWYLDGKMKNKVNTFKDFISSTEYLIQEDYISKDKVVANGGSAGGLLMGGIVNMRPDLYNAVVLDVPFVDVINTISDESLPLTPPEWVEWGNPITNKDDYEYMMTYSPYDNVRAKDYPNMLFNSGITDEQVTYWEPTKMVAKLRELKTDKNELILKMKMSAGHAGSSARYEKIKEIAFNYAFILKSLRMS